MTKVIKKYSEKFTKFIEACAEGDNLVVEDLLPRVNPHKNGSYALYVAAARGHLDIVKLLLPLPFSDPSTLNPLGVAAQNGHTQVVEFLLQHFDPKENNSEALFNAAENGRWDIVDLLWTSSAPEKAIEKMKKINIRKDKFFFIEERLKSEKSQKELIDIIVGHTSKKTKKSPLKM